MSGKRIFITGIAGFLGSHIAERCLAEGYLVSGCDNLMGGYRDNVPDFANCCADKARRLLDYQPKVKLEAGLAVMIDWIKARGPRPFVHNVELEIAGPLAPKTWSQKIL